jgi:two-component system sensor histidine kinase KdpD
LKAILTSASALAREDLHLDPADQRELIGTIHGEARRLSRLIDNLLDLSRLEAGAAQPEPDVWVVDDLIAQALDETGEAGSRIEVDLPEQPVAVRADSQQIERVLVNLSRTRSSTRRRRSTSACRSLARRAGRSCG